MNTFIGVIFCALVGAIAGLLAGLLLGSGFAWLTAGIITCFSIDVVFNGTKDGM